MIYLSYFPGWAPRANLRRTYAYQAVSLPVPATVPIVAWTRILQKNDEVRVDNDPEAVESVE